MTIATEPEQASLSRHFGARGGQLRISVTPRCQIGCSFCHNEGETPPRLTHENPAVQPRPPVLGAREILTTIEAMVAAGVRRVFITGGEPLVSALARPVLQGLPQTPEAYSTTLITNGLRLEKDLPWLAATRLDRIKVSLHYFSDETFAAIAGGRAGGIAKIKRAIEAAVEIYGPGRVDINTVLQAENEHEVREIIAYALGLGVGMQFIELVGTEHNRELGVEHVPASSITGYLRQIAESEHIDSSGTGQNRRVFTVGGSSIDVIDASLGRYHVGQCATCPVKHECVEGFWALRLEAAGAIRPCLLREDLRLDVRALLDNPRALTAAITRHVDAFTEGVL